MWTIQTEKDFFINAISNKFASPEILFYKINGKFMAYIPKGENSNGSTLQSRNSLIGRYTEVWAKNLIDPIATKLGLYAVNEVVCEEISLTSQSSADIAICTTNEKEQKPENIKMIFEVKMSIVSNFIFNSVDDIICTGDCNSHKGVPSILRSDSMLKAIGKSVNIRISSEKSSNIPIIVLGNTPITNNYIEKVDLLRQFGICQGFWSLNPEITNKNSINKSDKGGFITVLNKDMLEDLIVNNLNSDLIYFSGMKDKQLLGEIISRADGQTTLEEKAEEFLRLLREKQ